MATAITSGKRKGLEAVADSRGVIAALARVPGEMLVTFKEAVSRILTPYATAILLDPEYGLPAAKQRAKSAGLLQRTSRPGMTSKCADACRDCWRDGRSSDW